ncbi:MAG: cyanobactin maturation protease PatG family protein [Candidatus Electronema sp. V4]|uniref:cyanobactin maturation protease PatG family protein n=1 Tax=Candidatus Electronema sp. V4 TaxID=3454756 RepID=UPI00405565A3
MITHNDTAGILPGLKELWAESLGSPEVVVAVLDGPADLSHPCFAGAALRSLSAEDSSAAGGGTAAQHGTHVASIIFGQHQSDVKGIAPKCRGLLVPVFADEPNGGLAPCSQIDLARAITQAVEAGAHVINISGGQLAPFGEADRLLMNAIRLCQERDVLLVAAAGNDGCDCLHVPAALESVLAVGAMDSIGQPVAISNWGRAYQSQGILAPGENIPGALPGGGTARRSGTSFAAPTVTGIAALLLSVQRQQGRQASPHAVREVLLQNVLPCNLPQGTEQQRCLMGRLNVSGSHLSLTTSVQGGNIMSENEAMVMPSAACGCGGAKEEVIEQDAALETAEGVQPSAAVASAPAPAAVTPSAGCPSCPGGAKLVYALGELGTDFGSEARKDSFTQDMMGASLLEYLAKNPWAAQNLIWTLNLDATPIYAIVPQGPFASVIYERLREFLADTQIERASIPGYIGGTIKLMSGQTVPVIVPEVRGMYSWTIAALSEAAVRNMRAADGVSEERARMADSQLRDYLNRIYYDYRNLGMTPQERALNFSATNAFQITSVLVTETEEGKRRVLDSISVEKSPLCRPDSDCYDVRLVFFDPENTLRSRRVYRYTVDVSEVLPVTIGKVRSWAQS